MKLEAVPYLCITSKHPKCKGTKYYSMDFGWEYDCEYNSILACEDCKYGLGRKNPKAKINQPKNES